MCQHYCDQGFLNRVGAAYDLLWDIALPISTGDCAAAEVMVRRAHMIGWRRRWPMTARSTSRKAGPNPAGDGPAASDHRSY